MANRPVRILAREKKNIHRHFAQIASHLRNIELSVLKYVRNAPLCENDRYEFTNFENAEFQFRRAGCFCSNPEPRHLRLLICRLKSPVQYAHAIKRSVPRERLRKTPSVRFLAQANLGCDLAWTLRPIKGPCWTQLVARYTSAKLVPLGPSMKCCALSGGSITIHLFYCHRTMSSLRDH